MPPRPALMLFCPALWSQHCKVTKGVLLGTQARGRSWPAAQTKSKTSWAYRQGVHLVRAKSRTQKSSDPEVGHLALILSVSYDGWSSGSMVAIACAMRPPKASSRALGHSQKWF